ncbi:hypothetical protein MATL_G00038830 [Megalops atlanticus]|uniref:Uncharacterized protein n=1 Tax=Megalops atlanticus TaxID=7932 RepID=A0A9D3QE79_MEGAT|nr:hypothetical protein MATL_G00038830 [Megalops atlanticus]
MAPVPLRERVSAPRQYFPEFSSAARLPFRHGSRRTRTCTMVAWSVGMCAVDPRKIMSRLKRDERGDGVRIRGVKPGSELLKVSSKGRWCPDQRGETGLSC